MPNQRAKVSRVARPVGGEVAARDLAHRLVAIDRLPRTQPLVGPREPHVAAVVGGEAEVAAKAAGLSRSPKPPRSLSSRPATPVSRATSAASSSRVSSRPSSAAGIAASIASACLARQAVMAQPRRHVVARLQRALGGHPERRARPRAGGAACRACAHVLTSVRSSHSARSTAPRSSPSTRAHSVSSADDVSCACRPAMSRTTSSAAARGRAPPAAGAARARRAPPAM